jgi:hypothetical protein
MHSDLAISGKPCVQDHVYFLDFNLKGYMSYCRYTFCYRKCAFKNKRYLIRVPHIENVNIIYVFLSHVCLSKRMVPYTYTTYLYVNTIVYLLSDIVSY